ncbi:MAG: iron-containing alcohol dehydrogenase [Eubacteriales bacterium]|nr:iron-containing alcohol dehydrogenase [Eubacteriales bacterium]
MDFSMRTKLVTGYGCLNRIGEIVQGFGVNKVMLCTDSFLDKTKAAADIRDSLSSKGITCVTYLQPQPEPVDTECDRGAAFCREQGIELIVALGGGSAMDQSKAMAAIVTNNVSCRELDGVPITNRMLPVICVPTTAGTGSEVTFVSVITNTEKQYKMTIMDADTLSPDVAICDPALLETLPKKLIAACGVDALTHAIEAYTAIPSNPVSSALALQAIEMISANLKRCWECPTDSEAQSNMMLASTMAGSAFINSDVGAVHAIAETVGVTYHIPHGVANSLFLPYVMEFNRKGFESVYARIAVQLGVADSNANDEENSIAAVRFVEQLVKDLEIPSFDSFSSVKTEDFEDIAQRASVNPLSYDNIKPVSKEDYMGILQDAYQNKRMYVL